jgi:two-component system, sensor histidine kinase
MLEPNENVPDNFEELRRRAEDRITKRVDAMPNMTPAEIQRLVHELDVYRVELEMQNDELRKSQQDLEHSRNRYADLFEFAPLGYVSLDDQGVIREINLTAARMLEYERAILLGKQFSLFVATADKPIFSDFLRHCRHKPEADLELRLNDSKKRVFPVQLHCIRELTPQGNNAIRMAVADVTAIHEAKQAAELANAAKSQFLARMSHELRTPMNGIMGMTNLVLEEELTPKVRDCLETAAESAETLLQLLNEILDFSRIEAGQLRLEPAPFLLHDLLERTVKSLQAWAERIGLMLNLNVDADVPNGVVGDSLKLRQILTNLMGNAIKFTEKGGVTLAVSLNQQTDREAVLYFAVTDTGIGISKEDQKRIFTPFAQADSSRTRRYGGTGLGLSIVRSLVELMGGRIDVQSRPSGGSTFRFTVRADLLSKAQTDALAVEIEAKSKQTANVGRSARPLCVLVAEDTPSGRKLIRMSLEKLGHEVVEAHNGQEAVDAARDRDFDVVLMDIQMPLLDGFQATAAIRALQDHRKARVPVIALTAHAYKSDEEQCLSAGMDGYLSKPVDRAKLVEILERFGAAVSESIPSAPVYSLDVERAEVDLAQLPLDGASQDGRKIGTLTSRRGKLSVKPAVQPGSPFDYDRAVHQCFSKQKLFQEMIRYFFLEADSQLTAMRQSVRDGNAQDLAFAAHRLKNTLVYLAAEPAEEAAYEIERMGMDEHLHGASAAIDELERRLAALKAALAPHRE